MVPFLSFPKGSAELAMASSQTILNIRERPIPVFAVSESVCVCVCVCTREIISPSPKRRESARPLQLVISVVSPPCRRSTLLVLEMELKKKNHCDNLNEW